MSLNQLSMMIAAVAVGVAAWRVHPALGVYAGLVGCGAIIRAFVEIHWRRLQRMPVGPKRELGLVASSAGVVTLITGSAGIALVLPIVCLVVLAHLLAGISAFLPTLGDGWDIQSRIGRFLVVIFTIILVYGSPLIGLTLAVFTLGATAFHLWPISPDPRENRRKPLAIVSIWLVIVVALGGLELGAFWLETSPGIRAAEEVARATQQSYREKVACLDHVDSDHRCSLCAKSSRAAVLVELDNLRQNVGEQVATATNERSSQLDSWQVRLFPVWLVGLVMLAVRFWLQVRERRAARPSETTGFF